MEKLTKFNKNRAYPMFGSIFDELFNDYMVPRNDRMTHPSVNVMENSDKFTIEVLAPGYQKDNFDIQIDKDRLTISSSVESKKEDKNDNYTHREFYKSSFCRSFSLPENTDAENISADYKDGILNVFIPKIEVKKEEPKRIEIK